MSKIFFILTLVFSFNSFAFPDRSDKNFVWEVVQENHELYADPKMTRSIFDDDELSTSDRLHVLKRHLYKNAKSHKEFWIAATKLNADYAHWLVQNTKDNETDTVYKERKKRRDKYLKSLKDDCSIDYKPQPYNEQLPLLDRKSKTYSYKGATYNIHDEVVKPNTLKSGTCEWDFTILRRILRGAGCMDESNRICSGYVICNIDGVESRRLATCSADQCSDGEASACAAERGYGSRTPADLSPTKDSSGTPSEGRQN